MSEREKILARIREALQVPAPAPGSHDTHPDESKAPKQASVSEWLPAVGPTFADRLALFQANSSELKTTFHACADANEAQQRLLALAQSEGWKSVASHTHDHTTPALTALGAQGITLLKTDSGYDPRELERCDAGITACDALIAQTGSVLVTSRSAGGRALSVLPPHHVVLASRDQLLADLPAAMKLLQERYRDQYPSFMSFITGPSRTGDIERILVLGAHGPKKLTVLLF